MNAQRTLISAVTALSFFVQATGLAQAAPPQAEAQPAPPPPPPGSPPLPPARLGADAIYLTDGGTLRGTLLEMLPNDHATIQLPTGQSVVVAWRKIERIERQPAQGSPEIGTSFGSAFVHVTTDKEVVLESLAPGGQWQLASPSRPDTAWLRAPMWHDIARDTPGLPKALGFPLFAQSF